MYPQEQEKDTSDIAKRSIIITIAENNEIKPQMILINSHAIKSEEKLAPGQYNLIAKFKGYQNVKQKIEISPGLEPYIIIVVPQRLEKFEFRIGKEYLNTSMGILIDGIYYPMEIFIDGVAIESYQTEFFPIEPDSETVCGFFFAPFDVQIVRFCLGFYYDNSLAKPKMQFRQLSMIDTSRLITHLALLEKQISPKKALQVAERLLKSKDDFQKLRRLKKEDIQTLLKFLESLPLSDPQDIKLRDSIIGN
jgi:hypothetical protein